MRIITSLVLFLWINNFFSFLVASMSDMLPFYIRISGLYDKLAGCQSAFNGKP